MTWTILVLVLAVALFLFGGMFVKQDGKKVSTGAKLAKKSIKLVSIFLIAGGVCRLFVPYYLTSVNPAIVQEMVNGMQEQQNAEKNKIIRKTVKEQGDTMLADAPVLGNLEADKTIYVWTAFSCPYCRNVHHELERVLADRDDVRVVIKNFSIHGARSDAPARATIAAKLQSPEKAGELVNVLMARDYYSQDDMKDPAKAGEKIEKNVLKMAGEVGLDVEKLKADMGGEVVARELRNVRDLARKFEIQGTPFLIIEGQAFPGALPYDAIIEALD